MQKRVFLQALAAGSGCCLLCRPLRSPTLNLPPLPDITEKRVLPVPVEPFEDGVAPFDPHAENPVQVARIENLHPDENINRAVDFDRDYTSDLFLSDSQHLLLESTLTRLGLVQAWVGHGNFNLIGFDELLAYASQRPDIGAFTAEELEFLDRLFHADAADYGFLGSKVITSMTNQVDPNDVLKISATGHYLYRGEPRRKYEALRRDVGNNLVLTSGVRNIVKQTFLFLAKTRETGGNLSRASRSIAPPGYSYHGIGDFDVGKFGMGAGNFTTAFSDTPEFRRMITLGYIDIRYTDRNSLGVRYEPWHVKIA